MNYFIRTAQQQLAQELQTDAPSPQASPTNLLVEIQRLREINANLEAKIARLTNEQNTNDQKLARREQQCIQNATLVQASMLELYTLRDAIRAALEKGMRDIQTVQMNYHQYVQALYNYQIQNQQLLQENFQLQQKIQQMEQPIRPESRTSLYSQPMQEDHTMSSTAPRSTEASCAKGQQGPSVPFAYSMSYNGLYVRGVPPVMKEDSAQVETRVDGLEQKFVAMSVELATIKQQLAQITQLLTRQQSVPENPLKFLQDLAQR